MSFKIGDKVRFNTNIYHSIPAVVTYANSKTNSYAIIFVKNNTIDHQYNGFSGLRANQLILEEIYQSELFQVLKED